MDQNASISTLQEDEGADLDITDNGKNASRSSWERKHRNRGTEESAGSTAASGNIAPDVEVVEAILSSKPVGGRFTQEELNAMTHGNTGPTMPVEKEDHSIEKDISPEITTQTEPGARGEQIIGDKIYFKISQDPDLLKEMNSHPEMDTEIIESFVEQEITPFLDDLSTEEKNSLIKKQLDRLNLENKEIAYRKFIDALAHTTLDENPQLAYMVYETQKEVEAEYPPTDIKERAANTMRQLEEYHKKILRKKNPEPLDQRGLNLLFNRIEELQQDKIDKEKGTERNRRFIKQK